MHDRRFENWVAALVASGAGTLPDDKLSSVTRGAITYAESEIRTATAQLKADLHEKEQQVNRFANLLTEIRNACGAANFPNILDVIRAHGVMFDVNGAPLYTGKDTANSGESTRCSVCGGGPEVHTHGWCDGRDQRARDAEVRAAARPDNTAGA